MVGFVREYAWWSESSDPNDRLLGDVLENVEPDMVSGGTDGDAFDAVFIGEPYDGAVIGRKGARKGPRALREELEDLKTYSYDVGEVFTGTEAAGNREEASTENSEGLVIGDLGDVSFLREVGDDTPVRVIQKQVLDVTREVYGWNVFPVFLGGDNSMTVPNVLPLMEDGDVGVVSLDAHLDCREVHGHPTSGTPYRQLLENGLEGLAVVGARDFETSGVYHDYLMEQGGEVFTAGEVSRSHGKGGRDGGGSRLSDGGGSGVSDGGGSKPSGRTGDLVEDILSSLGDVETIYVSLDCDVLDAAVAPGVSAPTPGGLSSRELYGILRELGSDQRVAGFEVVECAPSLDRDGVTVKAASRAVAHFLAGVATRDTVGREEVRKNRGRGEGEK
ncbi:MAG: agmatinase family protein [Halobacteria archaeon]